jgi:hypothetical protein
MDHAPRAASPIWGYDLGQNLGGSFTARAHGLLAAEFALLTPDEEEFGRLRLHGISGAELRSGDSIARFETSGRRYRMLADGKEVLVAAPKGRSIDELKIFCGGQIYEARVSFLRNLALAYAPDGEGVARLSGSFTGRSYEIHFATKDGCAFPVAIFLVWHGAANRRRAYRRGA